MDQYEIKLPTPNYYIEWKNEDGTTDKLNISDSGELLLNGNSVESLDDHKQMIKLLLKAICLLV
ncbi:hypothetical protein [Paenibacillus harenae]|uniref:hypothetical protein n=1 Tax=Paenibacillus harenae TaxID=306543 RepID=UPI00278FFD3B|nr:hypothetical protein [Paenibacillus harenae]MDQ0062373.1 hypothetical protein [Paenibacillus harenae]